MARLTKEMRESLFLEPYANWRFTGNSTQGYTLVGVSFRGQAEALWHTTKVAIPALLAQVDAADEEIRQEQSAADTAQGELRRLRSTVGELVVSHDELVKENERLRKALGAKTK